MDLVLGPRVREIVERLGAGPRLHTLTVPEARAASLARRSLLQRPREAVHRVEELTVPTGAGSPGQDAAGTAVPVASSIQRTLCGSGPS